MTDAQQSFEEFVRARTGALARVAYLLTGDHHLAEDLVQQAVYTLFGDKEGLLRALYLGAAIGRAAAMGMFPGRDLESVGRQLWAVVHGLTSLELAGALGDNEVAAQRWRDLLATVPAGYREPLPA